MRSYKFILCSLAFALLLGCNSKREESAINQISIDSLLDERDTLEVQLQKATVFLDQNPRNGVAYSIRARVFNNMERYDERIVDLNKAIDIFKRDGEPVEGWLCETYYGRGLTYQTIEKDRVAIEDFNRVLAIQPKYASALMARAFSHLRLSDLDLALADANEAIRVTPNDGEAYEIRSRIRTALGDTKGAEEDLQQYEHLSN